jgi:threonine dehydratase
LNDRPTLADVEAAHCRIAPYVRRTPTLSLRDQPLDGAPPYRLDLKLECHQVTGAFKPRGAVNSVLSVPASDAGYTASSGGNHGTGLAYAAHAVGKPAYIPLPASVAPEKLAQMLSWGAEAFVAGPGFPESNAVALDYAARTGAHYVHPFADRAVISGQGTVALELLEDRPDLDMIVVAIGGGGLAAGVAIAAKALKPSIRLVGVEPAGACAMFRSLEAGRLVTLDTLATREGTLAPPFTAAANLAIVHTLFDQIILVEDQEMVDAAIWLWRHAGIAAQMAGAAGVAALRSGRVAREGADKIGAIICGAGTIGISPPESPLPSLAPAKLRLDRHDFAELG